MPIENAAPQMGQQDAVSLLFANSPAARAAGRPLATLNQTVSAEEKTAVARSVDAASLVADQISQSIISQGIDKQRAIDAIRQGKTADETILRDQQAKQAQEVAINNRAVELYGANAAEPDSLAAKQAAAYADVRARRLEVQQQILEMQKTDFSNDPYGWIMNQFKQSGIIQQHNQLASIENTLTAEMQAGHQMAANQSELQKSLLPVASLEAQAAAVQKVRSAAEFEEAKTNFNMTQAINQEATSMASLLANRANQIRSLGQEQRNLYQEHINSLNESTKWEAGKMARQWQAMAMEKNANVQATFERGEQLLGLDRGSAEELMKQVAASGNHEDYAALVKYFWSGSMADPDVASRVAKYTNYRGLEERAKFEKDPVARQAAANNLEMTRWIMQAQAKFATDAKYKDAVFTSPEHKTKVLSAYTAEEVTKRINEKVLTITPANLNEISNGAIVQKFPALQAAIDLPKEQAGDDQVLRTFREYYKGKGGDSAAARAFADYNLMRLQTVTDKTITMQAGIKKPTTFMAEVSVPHPLLAKDTNYALDMTNPAAIERYMLLTTLAAKGEGTILPYYTKP